MTTETVSRTEAPSEPVSLDATVAELRRIADALEALGSLPPGEAAPWLSLSLLLDTPNGVDDVARAVLNKGATAQDHGGRWFHIATGWPRSGRGHLAVQTAIPDPDPEDDGFGYSREADDPAPVSPARVPLHTGSVVDGDVLITDAPEHDGCE